jgi:hypothetical protein
LCGCIFTYDPAAGLFHIYNNSDEAIYVYFQCGKSDSVPLAPRLELFHSFPTDNIENADGNPVKRRISSPEYRINAYIFGSLHMLGRLNKPRLPCDENKVTVFFITEKTMRNYDWEEIHKNQMFAKRVILTREELENKNWEYTYSP